MYVDKLTKERRINRVDGRIHFLIITQCINDRQNTTQKIGDKFMCYGGLTVSDPLLALIILLLNNTNII
jgi:hypothetical protein